MEGGEEVVFFLSGMVVFVGFLMVKLSVGDEVVFFDECYY